MSGAQKWITACHPLGFFVYTLVGPEWHNRLVGGLSINFMALHANINIQ
jgi:hypothetical protein